MEDSHRRDIALFRYSLVREASDGRLSGAERGSLVRELAGTDHAGPAGEAVRVGRSTLDRWVRAYRAGGFDALVPAPRARVVRRTAEALGVAVALKSEAPGRTALSVATILAESGRGEVSARTIQRHFARLGLNIRPDGAPPKVFGRFEAAARNDLWTGDAMHGPTVAGRKTYLLGFIDDHSRLLAGYLWTFSEDTVHLESALRPGLGARGVPGAVLVDNGSAFVAAPFLRACAVLGIRLIHAKPRAATTKGKIERFWRTVRSRFVVEVEARGVTGLAELNTLFSAWVEVVYHRRLHSETGQTPLERFEEGGPPALPSRAQLHEAFLWSETRTVTKTSTVSLHGNSFEVDAALVGRRAELVFDPFDLTSIEVRFEGRPMGLAVPVRIARHTHPKARPDAASASVPAPTGIDYLSLVAARRSAELSGERIDFAALAAPEPQSAEPELHHSDEVGS
ncbi:MAG: DDE-type integrase/transposase/recombinase [Actinomycetota bacterium]|nr:DDE-type integrase/transposase/recombinase [Actinomycetota bacterium]